MPSVVLLCKVGKRWFDYCLVAGWLSLLETKFKSNFLYNFYMQTWSCGAEISSNNEHVNLNIQSFKLSTPVKIATLLVASQ